MQMGLLYYGTVGLWCCGMGRRKVSITVPLEFTCISIQVVLWYVTKNAPKIQNIMYFLVPIKISTKVGGILNNEYYAK